MAQKIRFAVAVEVANPAAHADIAVQAIAECRRSRNRVSGAAIVRLIRPVRSLEIESGDQGAVDNRNEIACAVAVYVDNPASVIVPSSRRVTNTGGRGYKESASRPRIS